MQMEYALPDLEDFFQCAPAPPSFGPGAQNLTFELLDEVQRFVFTWNPKDRDLYLGLFRLDGSTLGEIVALNVDLSRKGQDMLLARSNKCSIEIRRKPRNSFKVTLL